MCVCVCVPAWVKGALEARWGRGVGASTVCHTDFYFTLTSYLHFSAPAGQVQLLWRINLQLSAPKQRKHTCMDAHDGRGDVMGSTTLWADFQQMPFSTVGFILAFLLEFSLLINPEPLRVSSGWSSYVPTCLQAIGFLFSSFCQGNYHSSIHFSPSKNLLKAFITNCLSFFLTLLSNLFFKIPWLSF